MKAHTTYLALHVPTERGFVNITPQVEAAVRESGVREGLALVNSMHPPSLRGVSAGSVFINDHEPGLWHDFEQWLETLAPYNPSPEVYRHCPRSARAPDRRNERRRPPEADDHGPRGGGGDHRGKLDFGAWEQIFYGEFDGRRDRRVLVKIIGE